MAISTKDDSKQQVGDSGGDQAVKEPVRKTPNPIDVHVGSRVRLRRMVVGMSQEKLGDQLGLTFQQIQKYEKGSNRIGASRLFQLSQILGVPVQFFFEQAPTTEQDPHIGGFSEPSSDNFVLDFINSREGLELNRAFVKIKDPNVRRRVIELVRAMALTSDVSEFSD